MSGSSPLRPIRTGDEPERGADAAVPGRPVEGRLAAEPDELVPPAGRDEARVDHHRVSTEPLQDRGARAHLGDDVPATARSCPDRG
jgi:hypothetical protein